MERKKRNSVLAGVLTLVMVFTAVPGPLRATEEEEGGTIGNIETYTVQPGDTLWGIARERSLDPALLAVVNEMPAESLLRAGQELQIPKGNFLPHIVTAGETLWSIAQKYNTAINDIVSENDLDNPDSLVTGEEILIPVNVSAAFAGFAPAVHSFGLPMWPTFGVVSSIFGPRGGRRHEGLDIAAEEGAPIRAVRGGKVVFAGARGSYGNAVIINHGSGLRTLYAHASKLEVSSGDVVEDGREIARVGNTGRSTGPHLHFELLYRGTPLNPSRYLPAKN